jgi:hypothetical protein
VPETEPTTHQLLTPAMKEEGISFAGGSWGNKVPAIDDEAEEESADAAHMLCSRSKGVGILNEGGYEC